MGELLTTTPTLLLQKVPGSDLLDAMIWKELLAKFSPLTSQSQEADIPPHVW